MSVKHRFDVLCVVVNRRRPALVEVFKKNGSKKKILKDGLSRRWVILTTNLIIYIPVPVLYSFKTKNNITVHIDSSSHQKAMDLFLSKQRQQNSLATFLENPLSKNVTSLELRLCLFVAEHNMALSSAEHILQLFKTE